MKIFFSLSAEWCHLHGFFKNCKKNATSFTVFLNITLPQTLHLITYKMPISFSYSWVSSYVPILYYTCRQAWKPFSFLRTSSPVVKVFCNGMVLSNIVECCEEATISFMCTTVGKSPHEHVTVYIVPQASLERRFFYVKTSKSLKGSLYGQLSYTYAERLLKKGWKKENLPIKL